MKKQRTVGRPLLGDEKKKSYNVYLEPKKRDKIVKKHGSLTAAIETTIENTKPKTR